MVVDKINFYQIYKRTNSILLQLLFELNGEKIFEIQEAYQC